jgi:hypothetical protein
VSAAGKPFEVLAVRHRTPVKPRPKPSGKPEPLPLTEVIERVERIAELAIRLQGIGHTSNAHAFAEGKSEIVSAAHRLVDDLRKRGVAGGC